MYLKYPLAIISNKNSKKNRLGILSRDDIKSVFSDDQALYYWTSSAEELTSIISELAEKQVSLIFSNGGDGTHRSLIKELIKYQGSYDPIIVPLRGGTMNMLADNIGVPLITYDAMGFVKQGIENSKDFKVVEKPVLKVKTSKTTEYGFVFMAGTVYRALELYYESPVGGVGVATKTLGETMIGWLLRDTRILKITEPVKSNTMIDDKVLSFPYVIAIVSTLPRLILHFNPFVGPKRNKKLSIMLDGEKMIKNYNPFKFFKISKKEVWDKERVLTVASNVEIDVKEGFSIDGEMFKLDKDERIYISEGATIKFLSGERWIKL